MSIRHAALVLSVIVLSGCGDEPPPARSTQGTGAPAPVMPKEEAKPDTAAVPGNPKDDGAAAIPASTEKPKEENSSQ